MLVRTDRVRAEYSLGLCLCLVAISACQTQLPVVDDTDASTAESSSNSSAEMTSQQWGPCKDSGAARLIRPVGVDVSVHDMVPLGNDVLVSEQRTLGLDAHNFAQTSEFLYRLSADGTQQVLFSHPALSMTNLVVQGDTLLFIGPSDVAGRAGLYSMSLSEAKPTLMFRFENEELPTIIGADDAYVYTYPHGPSDGARISRADATRTPMPYEDDTQKVIMYRDLLWYMVYESDDPARPDGLYQLDGAAETPAETRVSDHRCGILDDWVLSSDRIFCAGRSSIYTYDLDAPAEAERNRIYTAPSEETGNLRFSAPDGDFVYLQVSLEVNQQHPIRRLNLRTSSVDDFSCDRRYVRLIAATPDHVFWSEWRDDSDTSKDGIYVIAKR